MNEVHWLVGKERSHGKGTLNLLIEMLLFWDLRRPGLQARRERLTNRSASPVVLSLALTQTTGREGSFSRVYADLKLKIDDNI